MGATATSLRGVGRAAEVTERQALLHRVEKRAAISQPVAHLVGALDVFLLLFFVLPPPACCPRVQPYLLLNGVAGAVFVLLSSFVGTYIGKRLSPARMEWAQEGRAPTPEEQARVLNAPNLCFKGDAAIWLTAVVFFAAINAHTSWALAAHIGWTVFLGGMTTCGIAYLLLERDWRPLTELALAGGQPARPAWPRIEGRLIVAWLLATGVPVLGLITLGVDGVTHHVDIARGTLVLGTITLAISATVTYVTARRLSVPLTEMRKALGRVQAGDLASHVRVSDGSEVGFLQSGFNSMVAGLRERERTRDLYAKQVGEDVARVALSEEPRLGGTEREVAALFVDVIGSTGMALDLPPERVVARLNRFFAVVVEVVGAHGGWVNKFEGDAALAVFGAPTAAEDAAGCALAAARTLQTRLQRDVPEVQAAIGVSAGPAVAGWVGAAQRFEYTVIGDPVNVASRLSELAKREDGRLLASEAIVSCAGDDERERWALGEAEVLRGRTTPTQLARPVLSAS